MMGVDVNVNVFLTSPDFSEAASHLDDLRIIAITKEVAQILSTVVSEKYDTGHLPPLYKPTHKNHPIVRWAAKEDINFFLIYAYGVALGDEWEERFDKVHASSEVIDQAHEAYTPFYTKDTMAMLADCDKHSLAERIDILGLLSDFPDCTGGAVGKDLYERYRNCLNTKWNGDMRKIHKGTGSFMRPRWSFRGEPYFFIPKEVRCGAAIFTMNGVYYGDADKPLRFNVEGNRVEEKIPVRRVRRRLITPDSLKVWLPPLW